MTLFIVSHIAQTFLMALLGICFAAIMIGAYYDIWVARQQKKYDIELKRMRTARAHVTVIIDAKANDTSSTECLAELFKNRYRQFDAVIMTNGTRSDAYAQALQFKRARPSAKMRVYAQRKPASTRISLQRAYAKSERGEYVVTLRSDHLVPRTFIRDTIAHFVALTSDAKRTAVLFGTSKANDESLVSSLRIFALSGVHMMRKIFSTLHIEMKSTQTAVMYEKTYVTKRRPGKIKHVFDSTINVRTATMRNDESLGRIAVMVAIVCLVTYSLVLASTDQNTALLLFGWLAAVAYFGASLWSYEYVSAAEKTRLSITLPSLYFFGYVLLVRACVRSFRLRK